MGILLGKALTATFVVASAAAHTHNQFLIASHLILHFLKSTIRRVTMIDYSTLYASPVVVQPRNIPLRRTV